MGEYLPFPCEIIGYPTGAPDLHSAGPHLRERSPKIAANRRVLLAAFSSDVKIPFYREFLRVLNC